MILLADAVFAWCIRNASREIRRCKVENAIHWCKIAGQMTEFFASSYFSNEQLESVLRQIGVSQLPQQPYQSRASTNKIRWLHVMTHSFETGGHTALCRRWIELDVSNDVHDLAFTFQTESKADPKLLSVIKVRGGNISFLSEYVTMVERAAQLKSLALEADVVVLHVHMWDPIPAIAFAQSGGPAVLVVNHSDHLYWTGASVVDLILNIRPSGEVLCSAHRGCNRLFKLPIPLPFQTDPSYDVNGQNCREQYGIPQSAMLFLTIGTPFKYVPMEDFSFLAAAEQLLFRLPQAYLIAVGPSPDDSNWADLAKRTQGRVIAVGIQKNLSPFHAAADVYLEGFPFGSLTALLEATLAGLMPVLAPAACPLPYRSDDFALDELKTPRNIDEYVQFAVELALDDQYRQSVGEQVRQGAQDMHCQPGWSKYINKLRTLICAGLEHQPSSPRDVEPLPGHQSLYWAQFCMRRTSGNPFGYVFSASLEAGLRPQVDRPLYRALQSARCQGLDIHNAATIAAGSLLLSMLPKEKANRIYHRI